MRHTFRAITRALSSVIEKSNRARAYFISEFSFAFQVDAEVCYRLSCIFLVKVGAETVVCLFKILLICLLLFFAYKCKLVMSEIFTYSTPTLSLSPLLQIIIFMGFKKMENGLILPRLREYKERE